MQPTANLTPDFLRLIAATWSETELRAAAAVLVEMAQDRSVAASVLEPEVLAGTKGDAAA